MVTIKASAGSVLKLGYVGENLARQICFDLSDWRRIYGDGTAALIARRCGDDEPYATAIETEGVCCRWTIRREDVAVPGAGECELRYIVGDTVVKTERWVTQVNEAMGEPGDYPDAPEQNYLEQVIEAGVTAITSAKDAQYSAETAKQKAVDAYKSAYTAGAAADRAEDAKNESVRIQGEAAKTMAAAEEAARKADAALRHAPVIGENGNWYVWGAAAGAYVDSGVPAAGADGQDGVGIASIKLKASSDAGNTYTVTLTDGTYYEITAPKGPRGDTGDGIRSITLKESTDAGNVYTVAMVSGSSYEFVAPVGPKGDPGVGLDNTASAGQFAIADGNGGITWLSLTNVAEVGA